MLRTIHSTNNGRVLTHVSGSYTDLDIDTLITQCDGLSEINSHEFKY